MYADSGASTGSGEGGDLLDNDAVAALAGLAPRTAAPQFRLQNASSMPQPSHQRLSLQSLHGPTGIMKRKSLGARSQLSGGRNSSVFRRSIGSSRHRSTDIMVFSTEATEEVRLLHVGCSDALLGFLMAQHYTQATRRRSRPRNFRPALRSPFRFWQAFGSTATAGHRLPLNCASELVSCWHTW